MTKTVAAFTKLVACQKLVELKHPHLVVKIAIGLLSLKETDARVKAMDSLSGLVKFCQNGVQIAEEYGILKVLFKLMLLELRNKEGLAFITFLDMLENADGTIIKVALNNKVFDVLF